MICGVFQKPRAAVSNGSNRTTRRRLQINAASVDVVVVEKHDTSLNVIGDCGSCCTVCRLYEWHAMNWRWHGLILRLMNVTCHGLLCSLYSIDSLAGRRMQCTSICVYCFKLVWRRRCLAAAEDMHWSLSFIGTEWTTAAFSGDTSFSVTDCDNTPVCHCVALLVNILLSVKMSTDDIICLTVTSLARRLFIL